jgi:hypothetical protein
VTASTRATGPATPEVTVRCKVPGGPWFVGLSGAGGADVQLGPYENPAVAKLDALKLRQFLASMLRTAGNTNVQAPDLGAPNEHQQPLSAL